MAITAPRQQQQLLLQAVVERRVKAEARPMAAGAAAVRQQQQLLLPMPAVQWVAQLWLTLAYRRVLAAWVGALGDLEGSQHCQGLVAWPQTRCCWLRCQAGVLGTLLD
jgi:hypothetical protein